MNIDEVIKLINDKQEINLNLLQELILRACWDGKTYQEISLETHYGIEHIRKTASKLWQILSDVWGIPINKASFRVTIETYNFNTVKNNNQQKTTMFLEFPSGSVPLNSSLYIARPPIEELTYQEITKPGSVIRIKAPSRTGKNSLLTRIIAYSIEQGYQTVNLDFQQAEEAIFASLDKFLRWFCANVSRQLNLKPMLDDYWDEDIGSKVSCTIYFQGYILEQINTPVVVALNEVNRVFAYPQIAQEFLPLLRSWHEEAKQNDILQKLRLIVVHSTEIYISLNINQSPFNVGLPIKLPEFTPEQLQDLATRHGLDWTEKETQQLIKMVGGHPYLVRIAFYYLSQQKMPLDELLETAPTLTGIYSDILRGHLAKILKYPELLSAIKQLITNESVQLKPIIAYQLESMGLVKLDGNNSIISCDLYRLYFATQNLEKNNEFSEMINRLQKSNEELYRLCHLDELTQLANRRQFDHRLKEEWQRLARTMEPLALILCDIDHFKIYNDEYGHQAGDKCLQQVAKAIQSSAQNINYLVGRYGGEEFAIILPNTEAFRAVYIAEKIREKVKELEIKHHPTQIANLPNAIITISLGIACTIPDLKDSSSILVFEADQALYRSKRDGRDRISISPNLDYGLLD